MLTTLTIIFINCAVYTERIDIDFVSRKVEHYAIKSVSDEVPCLVIAKQNIDEANQLIRAFARVWFGTWKWDYG